MHAETATTRQIQMPNQPFFMSLECRTTARGGIVSGIPDVRDGLTREERVVLWLLHEIQRERGGRNVPTAHALGAGLRTLLYQP